MAVTCCGGAGEARGIKTQGVEVVPLHDRGHGGRAFSRGKADHATFRYARQVSIQNLVGMSGGYSRIEDCAKQLAMIVHGSDDKALMGEVEQPFVGKTTFERSARDRQAHSPV